MINSKQTIIKKPFKILSHEEVFELYNLETNKNAKVGGRIKNIFRKWVKKKISKKIYVIGAGAPFHPGLPVGVGFLQLYIQQKLKIKKDSQLGAQ